MHRFALAALKQDGGAVAWGTFHYGGDADEKCSSACDAICMMFASPIACNQQYALTMRICMDVSMHVLVMHCFC